MSGQAIAGYEIEAKLFKALQGWQPTGQDGISIGEPLTRLQVITEDRKDDLRVRMVYFTTTIEDTSASPVYTTESPKLDLDEL